MIVGLFFLVTVERYVIVVTRVIRDGFVDGLNLFSWKLFVQEFNLLGFLLKICVFLAVAVIFHFWRKRKIKVV